MNLGKVEEKIEKKNTFIKDFDLNVKKKLQQFTEI